MANGGPIQENPISRSSGGGGPVQEGRVVADEERDGVGDTDMEPEPALGVGESISRRAEDIARAEDEPGREDAGTKGASDRPVGVSTPDDVSGVDPQGPIDDDSPTMPSG